MLGARARKVLKEAKIGLVLLLNTNAEDPNFIYATGLLGGLFEGNLLLITRKGITLFTSPLEYELAKEQLRGGIRVVNLDSKEKLGILISQVKGKTVGINGNFVPYNSYRRVKKKLKIRRAVDVSQAFEKARAVKERDEISRIRHANRITKAAITMVQKSLKVGMSEKEVAAMFDSLILKMGADATAFPSIVCFGKNAALPHHGPDNTRLKYGDFVLIDVGVKVKNYCSDVTRTMIFGNDAGRIKDYAKKKRIIEVVKEAQRLALLTIRAGVKGEKPHVTAQKYIDSADKGAYKGTFIHSLGHSIGIEVHDGSGRFLSAGSKMVLKAGMVSSVEPGIYIPGFGGARFEDDIMVTKKGYKIL